MGKRKKRNARRHQRVIGRELNKARRAAQALRAERDALLKAAIEMRRVLYNVEHGKQIYALEGVEGNDIVDMALHGQEVFDDLTNNAYEALLA